MSLKLQRENLSSVNIWSGFVDVLTALVMVLVFLMLVFVISQYILSHELNGQNKAVTHLHQEIQKLSALLSKAHTNIEALDKEKTSLGEQLLTSQNALEALKNEQAQTAHQFTLLSSQAEDLKLQKMSLEDKVSALLNQIQELQHQLHLNTATLENEQTGKKSLEEEVATLNARLKEALGSEALALANYKSEFFGKLKEALAQRTDIIIVGDRFMFQSEVLFDSASADLGEKGKEQLKILAQSLKEISLSIPENLNWILRIDGHTDQKPIHTDKFQSNWELSVARAICVVKFLIDEGIHPKRLAATGFGEYHPLQDKTLKDSDRNRRIELRIDQR